MNKVVLAAVAATLAMPAFAQTPDTGMWERVGPAFFSDTGMTTMRGADEVSAQWATLSAEDQAALRAQCANMTAGGATDATAATDTATTGTAATGTDTTGTAATGTDTTGTAATGTAQDSTAADSTAAAGSGTTAATGTETAGSGGTASAAMMPSATQMTEICGIVAGL